MLKKCIYQLNFVILKTAKIPYAPLHKNEDSNWQQNAHHSHSNYHRNVNVVSARFVRRNHWNRIITEEQFSLELMCLLIPGFLQWRGRLCINNICLIATWLIIWQQVIYSYQNLFPIPLLLLFNIEFLCFWTLTGYIAK